MNEIQKMQDDIKYRIMVINGLTNSEISKWYVRLPDGNLWLAYDKERDG